MGKCAASNRRLKKHFGGYVPGNGADNSFYLNVAASRLIKHQLISVIKRFKFDELESSVIPIFPEISWSDVRSKLIKNHKRFTVNNAARVIEEILNVRITLTYNFYIKFTLS